MDVSVTNASKVLLPKLCGFTQPLYVLPLTASIKEQLRQSKMLQDPTVGRRGFNWEGAAPPKCEGADVCEANLEPPCNSESDFLEPDETDALHYEFTIPTGAETVAVFSYFKDTTKPKKNVGWQRTTLHRIEP